jgi:hypothetical protein
MQESTKAAMQESTKAALRLAQMDLYKIHAHMSEAMDYTGGASTEEWQMLYSIMQTTGGLTDVIAVFLGDHKPKVIPADPYPDDVLSFTPPF